jgi:predicted dehydrogenase
MEDLRFAMIGAGQIGRAYALALSSYPIYFWPIELLPQKELLVEVSPELARETAARFGFRRSSTDWREAVADPDVDAVLVLVPNDLHRDVVVAAANAGKHIICEKPLARNADEALEMVEAVQRAGVHAQIGFNWRLTPAIQMARRLIGEGTIGDVLDFRGFWLADFALDPNVPRTWRFHAEEAGSGALADEGSHIIDFARYLVGEVEAVTGLSRTYIGERPLPDGSEPAEVDVDDNVGFMLTFENGAYGYIEATRCSSGRKSFAGFEVHGTKGTIAFNWERMNELEFYDGGDAADRQGFRTIVIGPEQPYGDRFWPAGLQLGFVETKVIQIADFLDSLRAGTPPAAALNDGLECVLVEEAVKRSWSEKRWVGVQRSGATRERS